MHYSHRKNRYQTNDAIALSDKSVPVVELRTVETEYLGSPYTRCRGSKIHNEDTVSQNKQNGYDITVCRTLRKVENIIKISCFLKSLKYLIPKNAHSLKVYNP